MANTPTPYKKMTPDYWRIANSLFAKATTNDWQRYCRHVIPALITAAQLGSLPDDGLPQRICSHAKTGVLKLASAHTSLITPRGINWFSYTSPAAQASVDERDWYSRASKAAQKEIENSNFYTALIGATIDRVATGTGLLLAEVNSKGLCFTHVPAGTYAIAENADHDIDTCVRKFKLTAHQAAQAFGRSKLSKNMQSALDNNDRRFTQEFEIWHLTMPRDIAARGNTSRWAAKNKMDYIQVYIDPTDKHTILEDGYPEFPYLCTRFLKYGHQVYGESPLAAIEHTIEDCIILEEALKTLAQVKAFPRILATANIVGSLDMRAGGITVISPENTAGDIPREWATGGDYNAGLQQKEEIKAEIDKALYVDILQNVTQVERQMTATEAQIRERERIMTFTMSFTQYVADFRPFMLRIFCLLYRSGTLPPGAPPELFKPLGSGGIQIIAPGINYIGRLAKLLESNKQQGLQESLTFAVSMVQATQNPEWMDYFKPYEIMQYLTDESNVPAECIRKPKEAETQRRKREAAIEAQLNAQMTTQYAAAQRDIAAAAAT